MMRLEILRPRPWPDATWPPLLGFNEVKPKPDATDHGRKSRWESVIAPPPLVGGDTLVGEDEVTAVVHQVQLPSIESLADKLHQLDAHLV